MKRYEQRADLDFYRPILLEVLHLYGLAIHRSLERTLGKYLKSTDGVFRNEFRDDWELSKVAKLLCTNNPAERPFAIAKGTARSLTVVLQLTLTTLLRSAYMKIYQSLNLRTPAAFSLSMCNGSYRPAESKGKQNAQKTRRRDNVALL